ncbi:MAG: GNAT family N-acetyltransferase [Myxococcales bacterium]|nr:GNAT family N-acetyltransferase [Myxococcales bacterium]
MHVAPRLLDGPLILRAATRLDAHPITRILREGADDGLVTRSDEVDAGAVSRQIELARAAANSLYVVAALPGDNPLQPDDDEVVGLLLLEGAPLHRLHDVARLTMAVASAHRNKNIGRRMMQYAMEVADASGRIRKIELLTRANNATAIHLYTSLGFAVEGRLAARLRLDDGSFLDDVCMARFKP